MADSEGTFDQGSNPSPSWVCGDKDGYSACFYPGFVRRASVTADGVETVLYEQDGVFYLPPDQPLPDPSSRIEIRGGPNERRVDLTVDDPKHEIETIIVRFKSNSSTTVSTLASAEPAPTSSEPATGVQSDPDPVPPDPEEGPEEWRFDDSPALCPPLCPTLPVGGS